MGKGAAMKELLNLPFSDLERRCRHNGLSLVGGREMMVSRLLSLEDDERQKGYDREDELRYGQVRPNSVRHLKDDRGWNANDAGHSERNLGTEPMDSQGINSAPFVLKLPIPQPELKPFTKKEKSDPVLPVSKWAREDDGSDDESKRNVQALALGYSSSGSDNGNGGHKADDMGVASEFSTLSQPDSVMNEEQRQKLRRLEVAVMEYRESLEDRGIRSPEEIEKRVANQRRRLQSEFGLSDSKDDVPGKKRLSLESRDDRDVSREASSRKRSRSHSQSLSPRRRSLTKPKDKENDVDQNRSRRRDRDGSHEAERQRGSERKKSVSREREGHDKHRERDMDRRKKGK